MSIKTMSQKSDQVLDITRIYHDEKNKYRLYYYVFFYENAFIIDYSFMYKQ